jgi:hypothetical protein
MIGEGSKKAIIKNAWLMAVADGRIQPEEKAWMRALIEAMGVSQETAESWIAEMRHGDIRWQTVEDRGEATELLKLMTGLAGADRVLDRRERDAYVALGKALGFAYDELRAIFEGAWGKDVLVEVFSSPTPVSDNTVIVASDDFETIDAFFEAAGDLPLERHSIAQISSGPALLIVHACAERPATVERVRDLRARFPDTDLIVVIRRDQAHHVSYALENGATRCMVEPIYPGELARLLAKL